MNPFRTVCSGILRCSSVVVIQMVVACSGPSETEQLADEVPVPKPLSVPSFQLADLTGKWKNIDPKTDYLTRVEILQPDSTDQLLVRMWGSCEPEECFWGDNPGVDIVGWQNHLGKLGLSLEWEFETWISVQTVRLVEKNLLQIETHTEYLNANHRIRCNGSFQTNWQTMKMG